MRNLKKYILKTDLKLKRSTCKTESWGLLFLLWTCNQKNIHFVEDIPTKFGFNMQMVQWILRRLKFTDDDNRRQAMAKAQRNTWVLGVTNLIQQQLYYKSNDYEICVKL